MSGLRRGSMKSGWSLLLLAALWGIGQVAAPAAGLAQPTPPPPAADIPAPSTPAPATPAPAAPSQPLEPKAVETVPVSPSGRPMVPQEATLSPVPVLTLAGHATWEEAYEKLVAGLRQVEEELKRLGLSRAGDTFVAYTTGDDLGFEYEVQVPFAGTTTQKPSGAMKLGGSYAGKVLKFSHAGSFADMDNTYEQIANYLDEKNVEQNELYIEQYRTNLLTASPDALEIDILVPVP